MAGIYQNLEPWEREGTQALPASLSMVQPNNRLSDRLRKFLNLFQIHFHGKRSDRIPADLELPHVSCLRKTDSFVKILSGD